MGSGQQASHAGCRQNGKSHRIILLVSRQKRFDGGVRKSSGQRQGAHHDRAAESHGRRGRSSVWTFGAGRDVGVVSRTVRKARRLGAGDGDVGVCAGHKLRSAELAHTAITVCAKRRGCLAVLEYTILGGAVLVFVVSEVLCRLARLVTAIDRRCSPGELNRQDQQKDKEEKSAHSEDSNGMESDPHSLAAVGVKSVTLLRAVLRCRLWLCRLRLCRGRVA